jgi:hypothetical protein
VGREAEKGRSVGDWVAVAQSEERAREGSEATTVKRLEGGGVTERGERKAEGEEGAPGGAAEFRFATLRACGYFPIITPHSITLCHFKKRN